MIIKCVDLCKSFSTWHMVNRLNLVSITTITEYLELDRYVMFTYVI